MTAKKKRIPVPSPGIVHPNAAGIDVGSEGHVVAVPADRDAEAVRPFGVFTADLRTLAGWLKRCGVTSVVLESNRYLLDVLVRFPRRARIRGFGHRSSRLGA